jgi:hypothetical protein
MGIWSEMMSLRSLTKLAKKLSVWLDDVRKCPDNFDIHVKTAKEAIDLLSSGQVEYISLDHDLNGDFNRPDNTLEATGTGYDVAKWIEEHAYKGDLAPISYNIHSSNPAGRERMLQALMNADKFWSSQRDEYGGQSIDI